MEIGNHYKKTKNKIDEAIKSYDELIDEIKNEQKKLRDSIMDLNKKAMLTDGSKIDVDSIMQLYKQPYIIVDIGKPDIWKVVVWRGVEFSIGWLESSNETFNVFLVNKYASYLGEIPDDISERFQFKESIPLKIFDGMLLTGKDYQDTAWERYKKHLTRREGEDRIKIKRGSEFDLIAHMISDGILPFKPQPVSKTDIKIAEIEFTLRDYQKSAWNEFLSKGAVGIYWAPGAGKTFIGLWALAQLKGRKIIFVPSLTLREQWRERILKYLGFIGISDIDIETYHSYHKVASNDYTLAIFDECHHLPANTFSKLATIKTKYRIGLSATPYREDGRSNYIFALTGFPIGLSWDKLFKLGYIKKPDIIVYLVKTKKGKIRKLEDLLNIKSKTLVFCDSLDEGKQLERLFGYPFISGQTKAEDRMQILKQSTITLISRVGDEGVSISNIERIIEFDYFGKSRRQALQRSGRGLHSDIFKENEKRARHIIIMTDEEFMNDWAERSRPYIEKGFKIDIIRA